MMLLPRLGQNVPQAPPDPLEPQHSESGFNALDLLKLHWRLILGAALLECFLWLGFMLGMSYADRDVPKSTSSVVHLWMGIGAIVHLPTLPFIAFRSMTLWMVLAAAWGFGVCLLAIQGVTGIFRSVTADRQSD